MSVVSYLCSHLLYVESLAGTFPALISQAGKDGDLGCHVMYHI